MKNSNHILLIILFGIMLSLNSCDLIAGIFKAGMGFGIFIVVAIIVLLFVLIARIGKK